eukprot:scaffold138078_cov145-Phaeocystis_antarctica.AAC.1
MCSIITHRTRTPAVLQNAGGSRTRCQLVILCLGPAISLHGRRCAAARRGHHHQLRACVLSRSRDRQPAERLPSRHASRLRSAPPPD